MPAWRLGKDMIPGDTILDPVTFDDLILALKCNYDHIGELEILAQAKEIIEQRLDDYWFLIKNNFDEILEAVTPEEEGK